VGVYVYAGTINRLPTAADRLPKHCLRIAKMLTTDCQNIADRLQKCPQRIATTQTTQTQKHYHCAPPYCYLFYKTHIQPHTNTHYI